jgi:hypothetical protein
VEGRPESEEFHFHAEESAQLPGAEVCIEGRKEGLRNRLLVHTFVPLALSITATQTLAVALLALASVTPTTLDGSDRRFSRVLSNSK